MGALALSRTAQIKCQARIGEAEARMEATIRVLTVAVRVRWQYEYTVSTSTPSGGVRLSCCLCM